VLGVVQTKLNRIQPLVQSREPIDSKVKERSKKKKLNF
jgi:hypothetical protein